MDFIFFSVSAVNGFDSISHYLRAGLIVNLCSSYAVAPVTGCSSNFPPSSSDSSSASAASAHPSATAKEQAVAAAGNDPVLQRTAKVLAGEKPDASLRRRGPGQGRRPRSCARSGPARRPR